MNTNLLDQELAYFDKHREEFLAQAEGKFVVIKGDHRLGFYDSDHEAYRAGVEMFGTEAFLIKRVLPEDEMHQIPAYYLGLVHASV